VVIKEVKKKNLVLQILQEENPTNPREWCNLGRMVCGHNRYSLGDEKAKNTDEYGGWDEWLEGEIIKPNNGDVIYLPLYLYDHSGLTMSTTPFSCPWDSGQVGWIYVTMEKAKYELSAPYQDFSKEDFETKVKEYLEGEVKEYDQYLTGDVYQYSLLEINKCPSCSHKHEVVVDSLCGCYGHENIKEFVKDNISEEYLYLVGEL